MSIAQHPRWACSRPVTDGPAPVHRSRNRTGERELERRGARADAPVFEIATVPMSSPALNN